VGKHEHPVTAIPVRGDIVSADDEGVVRLWERDAGSYRPRELGEHGYGVTVTSRCHQHRDPAPKCGQRFTSRLGRRSVVFYPAQID
jgi:hypothetical protein